MTTQPKPAASRSEEVVRKHKDFLWPAVTNFYQQPLVADHGQMQYLWDLEGRRYLDFFGGILTVSVGHCNPKITAKIKAQVDRLQHTSTLYPNEQIVALAEKLARSDLRELFGECHDLFIGIERRGVLQAVHLRLDLGGDFRVAVADRNREDAAEEIEITPAFEVPEILHLAVVGHQGLLVEIGDRGPEELFVLANDLLAAAGGWLWLRGHLFLMRWSA